MRAACLYSVDGTGAVTCQAARHPHFERPVPQPRRKVAVFLRIHRHGRSLSTNCSNRRERWDHAAYSHRRPRAPFRTAQPSTPTAAYGVRTGAPVSSCATPPTAGSTAHCGCRPASQAAFASPGPILTCSASPVRAKVSTLQPCTPSRTPATCFYIMLACKGCLSQSTGYDRFRTWTKPHLQRGRQPRRGPSSPASTRPPIRCPSRPNCASSNGASRSVVREAVKNAHRQGLAGVPAAGSERGCSRKRIGICSTPMFSDGCWSGNSRHRCSSSSPNCGWRWSRALRCSRPGWRGPRKKRPFQRDRSYAGGRARRWRSAGARYRLSCSRAGGEPQSILCAIDGIHRHGAAYQHSHDEPLQGRAAGERSRSQEGRGCDHRRQGPPRPARPMRKLIQEALDLITKREAQQVARRLSAGANRSLMGRIKIAIVAWARSPRPTHSFP